MYQTEPPQPPGRNPSLHITGASLAKTPQLSPGIGSPHRNRQLLEQAPVNSAGGGALSEGGSFGQVLQHSRGLGGPCPCRLTTPASEQAAAVFKWACLVSEYEEVACKANFEASWVGEVAAKSGAAGGPSYHMGKKNPSCHYHIPQEKHFSCVFITRRTPTQAILTR